MYRETGSTGPREAFSGRTLLSLLISGKVVVMQYVQYNKTHNDSKSSIHFLQTRRTSFDRKKIVQTGIIRGGQPRRVKHLAGQCLARLFNATSSSHVNSVKRRQHHEQQCHLLYVCSLPPLDLAVAKLMPVKQRKHVIMLFRRSYGLSHSLLDHHALARVR